MALVFRTQKDSPYDVEIGGVGTLAGSARGGIPVEQAAQTVVELQAADGKPLTGPKLTAAAKAYAEARGIDTDNVQNVDVEKLRVEAGAFPAGPTIEELSAEASARDRAAVPAAELATNPRPDVPEEAAPAARDLPNTNDQED